MNENLNNAFDQICDEHIYEAASYKKRSFHWLGAIAAVLAVVIAWTAIWHELGVSPWNPRPMVAGTEPVEIPIPGALQSPDTLRLVNLVATPEYPEMVAFPNRDDYSDYKAYNQDYSAWNNSFKEQYDQPTGYADSLSSFFMCSIPEFLSGEDNRAYSPLNLYLALAMLAETTGGNSQQQILELLGADSIEALRTQASHVWNAHYCNDGQTTSLLANSLWLDDAYNFKSDAIQTLADSYYASVFHGDLGTKELNEQLRAWLNSQTGGLLEEQAANLEMDPATVFALASTAYFSAGWESEFSERNTAKGVFHCKDFDLTTQFMNKTINFGTYYRGEDFGAVRLELSGHNTMWLILPDEDKTVEDILKSGEYWEMTQAPGSWENKKELTVNLSLPKFDISSQTDLIKGMKNLGVTDVFDHTVSDFTSLTDTSGLYVGKIDHAVRVAVDEEGVIGAAYTVIMNYYSGAPSLPDDEIDFILDRPFLFMVTSRDQLPLFTGVVEQP